MRVATYTRISTDEEHQPNSLEAQGNCGRAAARTCPSAPPTPRPTCCRAWWCARRAESAS
jgi:hypothetical protein